MVHAATFQEVERTLDVHLTISERSFDRGTHPGHGREVDHQIDGLLLEKALQQRIITDIALSAYYAFSCPRHGQQPAHMLLFDSRGIKIIEIFQARHPMSLGPQTCAEMRPNKASPACYQNMRYHYVSSFLSRHRPFDSMPRAWLNLLRKFSNATIAVSSTTSAAVGNSSRRSANSVASTSWSLLVIRSA